VSPSWRDRIEVFLAPDRVDLTRIPRGLTPRPGLVHSQPCAAGQDADWRPAVDALGRALEALAWKNADAFVTLSNHFVRLALVPRSAEAARRDERIALARHHLRLVYGDRADVWDVALGEHGAGDAVAAAVDPELVAAVRDACSAARVRLAATTPFLAEAFNSARPYLPSGAAWLAVGEPGRICVACLDGARWVALRSQRSQGELAASLPLALEQCRLAEGIEEDAAEVCVVTREALPAGLAPAGRWRFRTIPAPAPAQRRATA
jgi:hypothetical protein